MNLLHFIILAVVIASVALLIAVPRLRGAVLDSLLALVADPTIVRHRGLRFGLKNAAVSTAGFKLEISSDGGTTYTEIKQVVDIPDPNGEASDLDATNLASTSKEYIAGLRDSQSVSITGQRVATDAGQNTLRDHAGDVAPLKFKATFPDGAILTFDATIKKFGVTGGVDGVLMFASSIRPSGTPVWTGTGAAT